MKNILILTWLFFIAFHSQVGATESQRISVVYNRGIAPIKFTDHSGEPSGILNEYWQLVAEKSGYTFKFREVESFDESLQLVKNGEIDLHAGLFYTDERAEYLEYSHPVFELDFHIYTSSDLSPINTLENTKGFLLGVVRGGFPEKLVRASIPPQQIVIFPNYNSMFKAALAGEVKVFVSSDIHLEYYLSINNRLNPFRHGREILFQQVYYGATVKQNSTLMEKIKSAQQYVKEEERKIVKDRWLSFKVNRENSHILENLTDEEQSWLKKHPILKVSNELDWPPFDFNENGEPMGLSIDLLDNLAERMNIQFEYIHGYTWNELLEMVRNHQIDIVHSLSKSSERENYILFTEPYVSNQTVIITRRENKGIKGADDLHGKNIAVIDGYFQRQLLLDNYKNSEFVEVASPLEALKAVSSGQADATVRYNGVANYLIQHHLLSNLKFVNEFGLQPGHGDLYLGVRNDLPILKNILQKALQAVPREEMSELKKKWIGITEKDDSRSRIKFSEEEIGWLKNHKEITLGADYNWPPFDFLDDKGVHSGLAADYIELIEEKTGLKINVKAGVWSDIMAQMKRAEVDGFSCAVKTSERMDYLNFSSPYLSVPTVILVRDENHDIYDLADLRGKTVSINRGSYLHEWLKNRFPEVKLRLSTSNEASIEAVSYGEVDAYIGNLAVADYIQRKKLLTNLKVVAKLEQMETQPAVAISKTHPILFNIIEKVMDSISIQEHQEIRNKWYKAATQQKVTLTEREHRWLKENPIVRVTGDPGWAPVSFVDEKNRYVGIVPDLFDLIASKTDMQFEVIPAKNWSETLHLLADDKVDIVDAISANSSRQKKMNFSDIYLSADIVYITREDIRFVRSLNNIGGKRVATVADYITEDYVRKDFPEIEIALYENVEQGLSALSSGDVDIFVIDIPSFEYYARLASLPNLKISGLTSWRFNISIGVQKGKPELISILNKALGQITPQEHNKIYDSWVSLQEPLVDHSLVIKAALVAVICLLVIGYWNRRLSHEVTLRKKAEKKALQASRAKSDFLANMSHEIRTPMNSVMGFAELLDGMISDPTQKSYLQAIRRGGRTLLSIINDILDLSKIEAGKMSLKPEPVSMEKLFEEMREFFKDRADRKKLKLDLQLDHRFPDYILIDAIRLRQILINLIGNGVKFTDKGRVTLRAGKIHPGDTSHSIGFVIEVEDTGIGIPQDQLGLVFNKFQQQDFQDHSKYGGTGLGLSICQNLTRIMGGSIEVSSIVNKGSCFTLVFSDIPIASSVTQEDTGFLLKPEDFKKSNIIIADDVEDNRKLIVEHFRKSSLHFLEAENGEEVLKILSETSVSLIFLDLRMPGMDGYETIEQIRRSKRYSTVPVVAITASVMGEELEKIDHYGFDGYLRKPVLLQELLKVTAEFLPHEKKAEEMSSDGESQEKNLHLEQNKKFVVDVEEVLFPQWQDVKDRGDFELIARFAHNLHEVAVKYAISPLIQYSEQLKQHVDSFDIVAVDRLMNDFPNIIGFQPKSLSSEDMVK